MWVPPLGEVLGSLGAASGRSWSSGEHQAERGTAKIPKPSKVIFRFQNRCMWAGEPSLPICSLRCYINLFSLPPHPQPALLHCLIILPVPPLTLSPFVLFLTLFHMPCSSLGLFFRLLPHQVNLVVLELRSTNWDCFQKPILKWEISE